MYILVIKFDIPKQIYFFLSYYNDEKRDLKKYLSRSSSGLEKQKYFLNEKKRVDIDMLDIAKSFQVAISSSCWEFFFSLVFFHNHKLLS